MRHRTPQPGLRLVHHPSEKTTNIREGFLIFASQGYSCHPIVCQNPSGSALPISSSSLHPFLIHFQNSRNNHTDVMAHLESRKHISPDSGFPITLHPNFNPKIKDHVPPEPIREEFHPDKDRASLADPEKKALFSVAKRVDLTESIGTQLENIQLSRLSPQQLDELALLVAERGVVFFRDQDLTTEGQVKLFEHYGISTSSLDHCSGFTN